MCDRVRILLLEDDPDMRVTLAEVLDDEGYDVDAASSGAEAVEKAAAAPFDLMITDVRMGGMDGLEALARVKQSLPEVASLVITGYAGDADAIRALRLGAGDYLHKPFELADFLASVERIVAHRRQELGRRRREQSLRQLALAALQAVATLATLQLDKSGPSAKGGTPARASSSVAREDFVTSDDLEPDFGKSSRALHASRVAAELGRELGLSEDLREEVRIASLLVALDNVPGVAAIHSKALSFPAIRRILRAVDDTLDPPAELPLEAKVTIVSLALADAGILGEPAGWRQRIDAERPGLVDKRIAAAIDVVEARTNDDVTSADVEIPTHDRQLVSLGCALETSGDRDAADRAFDTVARRGAVRRETVDALLGRARVAAAGGRVKAVEQRLQEAHETARALGPTAEGGALLASGLLWTRLGHVDAAREALRHAIRVLDGQTILPGPQLARLALANPADPTDDAEMAGALQVLGRPEFTADLLGATSWLFPRLAEAQGLRPQPPFERILKRFVRDVPHEIARLFERGVLGAEARRATVEALISDGKDPLAWVPNLAHDDDAEVSRLARSVQPGGVAEEQPPLLRIHSFGAFEAWVGDTRVPESAWVSSKNKYLLACLAASDGADVSEDLLIERFWPHDVERGRRSLYNAKTVLRRCLQPVAWKGELRNVELTYVVRQGGILRLNTALPYWHDVHEFEKLSAEASRSQQAGDILAMLDYFRRMVTLYRGPYLDGCDLDWALGYRTRLERLMSGALTHLVENALSRRQPHEAIELANRLVDIDPCRQEAHQAIMQAHLLSGHSDQAARQFEKCRRRLQSELEIEPSIALVELYQRARLGLGPGMTVN